MKIIAALEREVQPDPDQRVLTDMETIEDLRQWFAHDKRALGLEEGIEKGLEKGLEMGAEKNARETAARMIAEGFELDRVCRLTRLSRDEVERLHDENSG